MTVSETAKKLNVKEEKILKLIADEKIENISIEDKRRLIIPDDFSLPYSIPKNAKLTTENCYKYIMLAIDENKYLDNLILFNISKEKFEEYVLFLEDSGYIRKVRESNEKILTNNYILTAEKGMEMLNRIKKKSGNKLRREFKINNENKIPIFIGCIVNNNM